MTMKICGWLCAGVFWAAAPAGAQIEVLCQPVHSHFLSGEETTVRIEVRNASGTTLILAGSNQNAKVGFELTTESGAAVPSRAELPFAPSDVIRDGKPWIRSIDLQAFFDLRNSGQLRMQAFVDWNDNAYMAARRYFSIDRGKELDKLIFTETTGKQKTTVRYSLRTVVREDGEILFLCLEDPETQLRLSATTLGNMVRQYPAALRRDAAGHLHVLHQSAPLRFTHSELSSTGRMLAQEHFASDYQMPDMQELDGHILVRGRPYIPGDDRRMPLGPEANH